MTGPITTGDVQKLASQIDVFGEAVESTSDHILCVSGPGGSLDEALRIGALLYDKGIGTRIEANQSCMSACSIVFMMGTVFFYEGIGDGHNSNRRMHVTSRLGFHRPELKLKAENLYDAAAVEKSFDIALQATLEFIRMANLGSRSQTMVLPDLIENMFAHKGQDFYFVETTGQTSRWDIDLDGFNSPQLMDSRAAHNACSNLGVWQKRYETDAGQYYEPNVEIVANPNEGAVFRVYGAFQSDASHECLIQLQTYSGGDATLFACGSLGRENLLIAGKACGNGFDELTYRSSDQLTYVHNYDKRALLPPATPLELANAEARKIESRARDYLANQILPSDVARLRAECTAPNGLVQVANVQNFVNMRRGASFSDAVVTQVPLGAKLRPADDKIYRSSNHSAQGGRCTDLCISAQNKELTAVDFLALNQCFDDNYFWYKLQTQRGHTGFVSARFLEY
ncbi:hypothetical protein [Parasedimentitalea huanghaiensis]|uniref:SH3 domain-containing protein n=1 Tax=Parasedimentitalea huanghaiensis TaxID=2682100 RepID=A0A6L6WHA1_9RHOB|nr:hypothetical protein [Zongyanglinia huanghaiensis]MVO17084.1 hypothetical protein [Zongyanglinia huanghaiensis]